MRPDQIERIQLLAEQLADTFIAEADPSEWSGDGKPPAELTQQERGDRYWCKKNAMATGGVLRYTLDLIKSGQDHEINNPAEQAARDADLDGRIEAAEKRAKAALNRVLAKAKGAKAAG